MSTWYVSTTGNDAGAGSLADPFKTIDQAVTAASPNDTIYLRAGRYQGHVLIDKNNLTLQSYPGEMATIDTTITNPTLLWTIDFGANIVGGTLRNLDISGGYSYAIKADSNHDDDHPEGTYTGASGLLIENCTIHDSGQHIIKLSPECDNITIRNNEIYNSGIRDPANGQGIDAVNTDNILIQNNYVHNTSQNGIYIKGGSRNGVIENNRVENVGFSGILLGQQTDYGFFSTTDNPGLFESFDSVARGNVVVNAMQSGIGVWGSKNALVENNTIVNCASEGQAGILVNDSEHFIPPTFVEMDRSCDGVTIRNNTISHSNPHPIFQIRDHALANGVFPTMSGNHYFQTNGLGQFWDERTLFKDTLANWKTYSGTDADAVESNPGLITAAAPADVSASTAPSQVSLSWIDNNDTTAPGASTHTYYIYRGEKPDFVPDPLNRIGITTFPGFVDSTVAWGQLYYYRITIDNGTGQQSRPTAVGRSPIATAGSLHFPGGQPVLTMTFDEKVGGSVNAGDLMLINLGTGLPVSADSASFDDPTLTASFHFPAMLADGVYRASLLCGGVIDADGDPVADSFTFDFVNLSGGGSDDTITIRTSTDGQSLEAFKNIPTTDPPTFTASLANLAFITLQGNAGDDIFNFNGPITPRTYFNGGIGQTLVNVNSGTCTFQEDSTVGNDNLAINVALGATAIFNTSQHLTNLSVTGNARFITKGTLVLVTKGISFTNNGRLNLRDNDMIYDYSVMGPMASWNGSAYTSVVGMVASGRNGGAWNGPGIMSSSATTTSSYQTLAADEASAGLGIANGQTALFDGEVVDSTAIIVKYTYGGDNNFDGKVNILDYARIDQAINVGGITGLSNGDYNYDGTINILDYVIADQVIATQGTPL
jgi:hypothetical protein